MQREVWQSAQLPGNAIHAGNRPSYRDGDCILAARKHLGTPFRHQGRKPSVGLDCVGLLIAVAKDCGRRWVDRRGYSRDPDGTTLVQALDECCTRIPDAVPGCIIAIEKLRDMPYHVGIISDYPGGKLGLIHTDAHTGKVVEHYFEPSDYRIVGFWEWQPLS